MLDSPNGPGSMPLPTAGAGPVNRLRVQLGMTVHPDTVTRMDELTARFKMSRGAMVDRLILFLSRQYVDGKVYCLTGEPCRFNRTDVPPIF